MGMRSQPDESTRRSDEWHSLRQLSIQTSQKLSESLVEAEDIAQTVLLRLWEKRQTINQCAGWVVRASRNEALDRKRHRKRWQTEPLVEKDQPAQDSAAPVTDWQDILSELELYLDRTDPDGHIFRSVFGLALRSEQPGLGGPPSSSALAEEFQREASPHSHRRRIREFVTHLARQGVSWIDLLDALRSPDFLFSSNRLARLAAEQSSVVAEQLCLFVRNSRIDLLLRASADRHTFDLRMQQAVWSLNERMFDLSRIHPKYMLLGGLSHLQRTLGRIGDEHVPIQDVRAQRNLLDPLLLRSKPAHYAERWLATALYGVLLEHHASSADQMNDELSTLLATTEPQSLQKIGIGWSWNNAGRLKNSAEFRQRLLQVVSPNAWPGGLSALPTVVISPYLSGGTEGLHALCRDPLLWELVLRALSSDSHVAVAGGLAFLKNMAPSLCPSPAFVDVSAALKRLTVTAAANPFLVGKLQLLTEWTV